MAKLQAKRIAEALKKAQRVGEVEESFSITDCHVVLRSLRSDEYEDVMSSIGEQEDIAYIQAFKSEHLSRSIIEINNESLREYDFVDVDVEEVDNKTGRSEIKTVTLERHKFIKDYVIATWSREAIDVAFRKFNDVVAKAERVAAQEVTFEVPDETAEEKYRRLISEAKEIEGTVPFELAAKVRDDNGYLLKQEWTAAEAKLAQVQAEGIDPEPVQEPPPVVTPAPVSMASILRQPVREPPPPQVDPVLLRKAAEIQALEGEVPVGAMHQVEPKLQSRNPEAAMGIIDQPPAGGLNPRFRPPPRV